MDDPGKIQKSPITMSVEDRGKIHGRFAHGAGTDLIY
jgi:hypothetical protein